MMGKKYFRQVEMVSKKCIQADEMRLTSKKLLCTEEQLINSD